MRKVLITDDVSELLLNGLPELDYEFDFLPDITFEEVKALIHNYDGLIINSKIQCSDELLSKAKRLRWIGRLGSGMEVINTVLCDNLNIKYFNTPTGNCQAVAEHSLGMLLSMMRNINTSNNEVKNGLWIREANRGEELSGKTVAILGYGNTGEAFARLLTGFEVKVLAYDKYRKGYSNHYVSESSYEEIFGKADVLSLHLPLTKETSYSINADFLYRFKKPIYLINTSRGSVLKTSDLITLIKNGKIKGAALDVLENEKFSTLSEAEKSVLDAIQKEKKIILTSHIAGWTHESKRKIALKMLENIRSFDF
jgi:D-3-phosphoglycerate dehydrogenase